MVISQEGLDKRGNADKGEEEQGQRREGWNKRGKAEKRNNPTETET